MGPVSREPLDLLLIRHGQSEGNAGGRFGGHGPTPLTERGVAQAEAAARAVAAEGDGLLALYSSDLLRARQTAEPLERLFGVEPRVTPALRERNVGQFTGLSFAEAEARFPLEYAAMMRRDPTSRPPGGESHADRLALVSTVVEEWLQLDQGGRIVVVSHAMTLGLVLHRLLGLSLEAPRLLFRTDNCAIHRLRRGAHGEWNVLALNDRQHLVGL